MLRSTWGAGLVLRTTQRLSDATQELLERGATCVLLDLAAGGRRSDRSARADPHSRARRPGRRAVRRPATSSSALSADPARRPGPSGQVRAEPVCTHARGPLRDRAQALRGPARPPRPARPAHRPSQPRAVPRPARRRPRSLAAQQRHEWRCCFSMSTTSRTINDSLGHCGRRPAADRARQRGCGRCCGRWTRYARFGGDEFTLLFEDLSSEREVVLIAERISQAVSTPIGLEQGETAITVSIGIAMVTDPTIPPETVIREADAAMYRAKELGRSRYELFDDVARQDARRAPRARGCAPAGGRRAPSCGFTTSPRSRSTVMSGSPASRPSSAGSIPSAA